MQASRNREFDGFAAGAGTGVAADAHFQEVIRAGAIPWEVGDVQWQLAEVEYANEYTVAPDNKRGVI